MPSDRVRKMEIAANEAFEVYRDLYYEGGVGSTYFWDLDEGFAGVVLLKKCECYDVDGEVYGSSLYVFKP